MKATCEADPDCSRPVQARGICMMHYQRAQAEGLLPPLKRVLHRLTSIDDASRTAICSLCGPVDIVKSGAFFSCGPTKRAHKRDAYKRLNKVGYHMAYNRSWRYGMPAGGYEALFEAAGGKCQICSSKLTLKSAVVDHDHACCPSGAAPSCGRCTRGILCARCNSGLGGLGDTLAGVQLAQRYLERYEARTS